MATQYSPILKLALPTQGELSGSWGDVVNDNITSMIEEAVAGLATINTWTTNSHTLTVANGTTAESRAAILELTDTGVALTGTGTLVCPAVSKTYIVKNSTAQTVTVKTASGSGVNILAGDIGFVYCDGTNVVDALATKIESYGYGAGSGSVTSVAMTVPTGLTVAGSPITTTGTLAVSLQSGYSIPTTTKQSQWDSAYTLTSAITATAAEINYLDITTLGTSQASKAVTADSNGDVTLSEELTAKSYNETYVALSGTTPSANCESGNVFAITLSGNTTFTFSSPPASGTAYGMTIKVVQDASASGYTVTWPTSVDWPAATAPTLTATASAVDVFVFYTHDGGTTWYGFTAGQALG